METTEVKPTIDMSSPKPFSTVNRSATARALGINVSNVSRILSRQRVPHARTLWKLAQYFGMSTDQLYRMLGLDD